MALVCGVDGCRAGWVAVSSEPGSASYAWRVVREFREIGCAVPMPEVVAIDIPIGLPEAGPRLCDMEARQLLRRGRASSVFPAPIRPVLHAGSPAEANELRRAVDGKRMTLQTWGIVRKVREVDETLRANPELADRVREVHPEVCFFFMTGRRALQFAKKRTEGREERHRALRPHFGDAIDEAVAALRSEGCAVDDVLDAFAALWTAQRIVAGKATTVPDHRVEIASACGWRSSREGCPTTRSSRRPDFLVRVELAV